MKISVLTPSYNSGKYVERAIQSVLKQNYKNWEHIIVDGKSTDNTIEVLKKYPHLKWITESDQGQSDAMNRAFSMSAGDIIVYLNADDWFEENVFEKVIHVFLTHQDIDMVVGELMVLFPDGRKEVRTFSSKYYDILTFWKVLFPSNPVCYFYKRKVQERTGKFPVKNHYTMDYWFLLKAYRFVKIFLIDMILGTFFLDGKNKTSIINVKRSLYLTVVLYIIKNDIKVLYPFYKSYLNHFGFRNNIEILSIKLYFKKVFK